MTGVSGYKLLIVDDHAHNLYTLRTLIEKHLDATVLEASSGREAIDLTLEQPDIDLIILDVQMPEMDGFQTASLLKLRKRTRDVPIIFLTAAFKSEEFQQRGFAVGAVDYLLKPIDDNLLINKISTYFRLIEKERSLNRSLEQKVAARTAELEQARQHLANILSHMGEALLVLNPEGVIKTANPAACRMLGYHGSGTDRAVHRRCLRGGSRRRGGRLHGYLARGPDPHRRAWPRSRRASSPKTVSGFRSCSPGPRSRMPRAPSPTSSASPKI